MRTDRAAVVLGALLGFVGCRAPEAPRHAPPRGTPGVRISMDALHRAGGVPPGWQLTPPPGDAAAGQRLFADLGCGACHAVGGAAAAEGVGPALTGMGSHHPPAYFLESIVNPDAVLIDGPGYVDPDGHSVMPTYPDLTVVQLADLVAYLSSLVDPNDAHAAHARPPAPSAVPPPPATGGGFLVMSYDVLPGKLADFERWFRIEGAPALLGEGGALAVDTWVDRRRRDGALTTTLAFRDDDALRRFLEEPAGQALGRAFDAFIGPHDHGLFRTPPVYRAATLSAP
ncbi:MAG TPA: c-type cytochrome [Candidatus Binatia bacterium]|nr:c-type cytochrome [Candidatus Binatia bacterium]